MSDYHPPAWRKRAIIRAWYGELTSRELADHFNIAQITVLMIWHYAKKAGQLPKERRVYLSQSQRF
jgi:hypothetical protein